MTMSIRAPLILLAAACASACETPWELLETRTLDDTWLTVHAASNEVVLGGHLGRLVRRVEGAGNVEDIRALDDGGGDITGRPLLGMAAGPDNDLYAWTETAFFRRTTANFSAVPLPVGTDGRMLAREWRVLSAVEHDGRMIVATRVGDGDGAVRLLLEGTAGAGWRAATFAVGDAREVTWVAADPDGTAWAGDGRADQRTLFQRVNGAWVDRGDMAVADVLQVVVAQGRLFARNPRGIRAVEVGEPGLIDGDITLPGVFTGMCALSDGSVVAVGPARVPLSSLWRLEGRRWANVNTGTREDLFGVACGPGDGVVAAGRKGMAIRAR